MTEFGKIDDPVDASWGAWPEDEKGFGEKFSDLALAFGGLEFGPAKIAKMLKDQFFTPNRIGRIYYLLEAVRIQLKILESQIGKANERIKPIEQKLDSAQFSEAVAVACEEAARSTSAKKIQQLAGVLVGSLAGNQWADQNEDIPAMIRDIAQLGDKDLKVLSILRKVHASAISTYPNLNNPDAFGRETPTLNTAIGVNGFHPDDFLSACDRLRGFGLAAEVVRNTGQMAPHDFCYRPTRRGLTVLTYLEAIPTTGAEAK